MIRKIKAFTIIELVVVMILTSIIVGIVYSAYSIVGNQYTGYKKINTQNSRVALLSMLLNKDFSTSCFIKSGEDKIFFYDKENNTITYEFWENCITRNSNAVTDTFFISSLNVEMKFLNQKQQFHNSLVDELNFETAIFEEQQLFHFKKKYAADILMKNETEQQILNGNH